MHWGDWDAMRDWWWVMAIGMTIFWGIVIWAVVRLINGRRAGESADDVLRRRFAAGEITEDEYRRVRATLQG